MKIKEKRRRCRVGGGGRGEEEAPPWRGSLRSCSDSRVKPEILRDSCCSSTLATLLLLLLRYRCCFWIQHHGQLPKAPVDFLQN